MIVILAQLLRKKMYFSIGIYSFPVVQLDPNGLLPLEQLSSE